MAVSAPLLSLAGALNIPVQANLGPSYIRFLPDGFIDPSSPYQIVLNEGDHGVLKITQSANRLHYEIHDPQKSTVQR